MNRLCLLTVVLLGGSVAAPTQDARSQIAGTVRSATSGEAITGAVVTLLSVGSKQRISDRTTTDLHGTFGLSGLAPGQYQLAVGKVGYETFHTKAPVTIARHNSTTADLVVSLRPNAAISGHVVDMEGHAVGDAEVSAYAISYGPSGATLSQATKGRTDELGQYRLVNLPAGKYLIQASPPRKSNSAGKSYVDAPVAYYPGATVPSQAVPIELNWGTEFTSADVWMPPEPTYTIAGVVWEADNEDPCSRCSVEVMQLDGTYRVSLPQTARVSPDGTFLLRGLTSGDYALIASRGTTRKAHGEVRIRDWHVEDARLTFGLEYAVSGEIVLKNPPEGIDVSDWSVQLTPINLPVGGPQVHAEIAADRQFSISEVPPAQYRFEMLGLPPGAYLETLRGVQLLPNSEFVVSQHTALSSLQAVVAFDAATLYGRVRSSEDQTSIHARVFVQPQPSQAASQIPITTETSLDGTFSVTSLAPGSYTVYALPASSSVQVFDPAVWAVLGGYARKVNVKRKEALNIEIVAPPLP